MGLLFSRDTRVFLKKTNATWEIPVLDGFSFSQAQNSSEITLNEMESSDGESRRARQMFNDSFAPAEWSFQSYMRPNEGFGPAEDALWSAFFYNDSSEYVGNAVGPITITASAWTVAATASNKTNLTTFDLYFVMGAGTTGSESADFTASTAIKIYKIEECVVNEAAIDFDVDGIATINWSGFGKLISEVSTFDGEANLVNRSIESTTNFLRNRLTQVSLSSTTAATGSSYTLTLTGGNITMNNNITYLTPETLGEVNSPLAHITGTRTIGGNFTCYLGTDTDETSDLFRRIISASSTITNEFTMNVAIGGTSGRTVEIDMQQCHLEVPQHSIEDVISLDTSFHALPSDIDGADEVTVAYKW